MNMIEPSQNEKQRAIETILSEGLQKPKGLWQYLCELYHALGFRYLFLYSGSAGIMGGIAAVVLLILYPASPEHYPYAALFSLTPLFFLFVVLLTETTEKVSGLYELKMTFQYNVQQITAFRILSFSLPGAVFCTLTSLYFSRLPGAYDLFRVISLSLCALFLCAFLTVCIMRRFSRGWFYFAALPLWIAVGVLPSWLFGERWELFLSQIPIAVTAACLVIAFTLFLTEIKMLMKVNKREVAYYVSC